MFFGVLEEFNDFCLSTLNVLFPILVVLGNKDFSISSLGPMRAQWPGRFAPLAIADRHRPSWPQLSRAIGRERGLCSSLAVASLAQRSARSRQGFEI